MHRRQLILAAGAALLAGCARLRSVPLNPLAWFGRAEPVAVEAAPGIVVARDPRPLVDNVTALEVERTPGGAVVRATGLPDRQGWYAAGLVPVDAGAPSVLAYEFRALPPERPTLVSTPASRELVVAVQLTDAELAGIGQIRVSGAQNALAVAR